jgi:hypothetical protein
MCQSGLNTNTNTGAVCPEVLEDRPGLRGGQRGQRALLAAHLRVVDGEAKAPLGRSVVDGSRISCPIRWTLSVPIFLILSSFFFFFVFLFLFF